MLTRAPLHTERLCLRPYEPADADAFFALLHADRPRFKPSFPDRLQAVRTITDAYAALRTFADDWRTGRFYVFGIWHRASADYVGDICLMPQQKSQAEIGYYLAAAAEGQGFAREALGAITDFGFELVGSRRLLVRCYHDNVRGQAVARAMGFVAEPPPSRPVWFRNADALSQIRRFWLAKG
ncbi:GNAT family N-acetyltransferase [Hymenobacter sp. UYCo722]|uniref:GNAT family N-acetyltransferase n=1 Tax=Hymenobacter sp. UYCo722 TaxID=3156335 RepID=UPI003391D191